MPLLRIFTGIALWQVVKLNTKEESLQTVANILPRYFAWKHIHLFSTVLNNIPFCFLSLFLPVVAYSFLTFERQLQNRLHKLYGQEVYAFSGLYRLLSVDYMLYVLD